jgi:hypothetical protein
MYFGYENKISDPLRVGVIGTGDEGSVLLGAVTPSFIQVKAICDIRPYNVWRAFHGDLSTPEANKARPGLMKKYDWKTEDEARKNVKVFTDYKGRPLPPRRAPLRRPPRRRARRKASR